MTSGHTDMLVSDLPRRAFDIVGDKPAIVGPGVDWTYRELAERTEGLAGHLAAHGVRAGQRIALVAPNRPETIATILAAGALGATVVPINLRLRPEDVRYQADDAEVTFTAFDPGFAPLVESAGLREQASWAFGDPLRDSDGTSGDRPSPSSTLIQLYTSGTTGTPKGCLLSQRAWNAQTVALAHAFRLTSSDVLATALPFFHVAGLHLALTTLAVGGTLVLPTGTDPASAWQTVTDHGVTVLQTIAHPEALLDAAPADLRALRAIHAGTGSRRVWSALDDHVEAWSGYGSTELCGFAMHVDLRADADRAGAIGRPLLGSSMRVADERGRPVPTGKVGELLARGPNITDGYWKLPDASAETLRDGWLHTGDLVRREDDGLFFFEDRLKDMVKPGGENVYCVEVENALLAHPSVEQCAVIGVPDKRWGEAVKAVVVVSAPVTPDELDAWCLSRLAAYKRPRWYELVDKLPRNALTKVLKTELRASHDEQRSTRVVERDR